MDRACEFCNSRMCLKASPRRCRHTGQKRTPYVEPVDYGACEFCGSRMCAKYSREYCRHTQQRRGLPELVAESPDEPLPPIPEEFYAPDAVPLPVNPRRGRRR